VLRLKRINRPERLHGVVGGVYRISIKNSSIKNSVAIAPHGMIKNNYEIYKDI
jgi:hypothetical protein